MESLLLRQANTDDAQRIAQVQVSTWQSAYLGMIPDLYLGSLNVDHRAQNLVKILESATAGNPTAKVKLKSELILNYWSINTLSISSIQYQKCASWDETRRWVTVFS